MNWNEKYSKLPKTNFVKYMYSTHIAYWDSRSSKKSRKENRWKRESRNASSDLWKSVLDSSVTFAWHCRNKLNEEKVKTEHEKMITNFNIKERLLISFPLFRKTRSKYEKEIQFPSKMKKKSEKIVKFTVYLLYYTHQNTRATWVSTDNIW